MFKSGFIKLNKTVPSEEKKLKTSNDRGIVYLGHVPHGFYEKEMNQYFSQFGEVTNINIPKSKKTGKARGFAFIEFMYPEVAKVVAETMNNYLMHKKILVAKYYPSNQVKSNTFWRCNKNKIPLTIKNRSIQRKAMELLLDPARVKQNKTSINKRMQSLQSKLKEKGIEYEIQTYNPDLLMTIDTKIINKAKDNENHSLPLTSSEPDMESNNSGDFSDEVTLPKVKKQKINSKKQKVIVKRYNKLRVKT